MDWDWIVARISRQCIENIRQRVNIHDVVAPAVALKRAGRNYVGLSPFSQETKPSFNILPEKNIFKCFSSGLAGDIFRFVELNEKLTFQEAVEAIAERFNISLEYEDGAPGPARESRSLKRELFDMQEQAADFFHRALMAEHPDSARARDYWVKERKFPLDMAREHRIGYAPPDQSRLIGSLVKKGFSMEAFRKSGLFYYHDRESNPRLGRPYFRGRLIIPVRNYQEQIIAFTARHLDLTPDDGPSSQAKYINSPETPLFIKSHVIFGLERARRAAEAEGAFLLVEGQLDVLRCWQHGLQNAAAPQGTSVTPGQLLLLKRYASRIDCLMDGDEAGQKAALRLISLALQTGLELRFLVLPAGTDPDTLLAGGGAEALDPARENSRTAMEYAVQSLLPPGRPAPREKAEALAGIFDIIARCDSAVAREEYLAEAAALLRADPVAARNDFRRFLYRRGRMPLESAGVSSPLTEPEKPQSWLTTAEYELLLIAFHHEETAHKISQVLDVEWIEDSRPAGRLLRRMLGDLREGLWEGLNAFEAQIEDKEEKNCYYSLRAEDPDWDDLKARANRCVKTVVVKFVNQRRKAIQARLEDLPDGAAEFPDLRRESVELRRLKQHCPQIT